MRAVEILRKSAVLVILALLITLLGGFAVEAIWSWHIAPLGAPEIGLGRAVGISALVSLLTYKHIPPGENFEFWADVVASAIANTFMIGYCVFVAWVAA